VSELCEIYIAVCVGNGTYSKHAVDKMCGCNRKANKYKNVNFCDQEYERVKEFKYIETILTEDNCITTESKQRIIMANNTRYGLKKELQLIASEMTV
jgi:hypothetical protein